MCHLKHAQSDLFSAYFKAANNYLSKSCYIKLILLCIFYVCREIKEILGYKNHTTCMKEAALLDYYGCGFWWAKEASFSPTQISFTMAVLHSLLDNVRGGEITNQEVFTGVTSCFQHHSFLSLTLSNTRDLLLLSSAVVVSLHSEITQHILDETFPYFLNSFKCTHICSSNCSAPFWICCRKADASGGKLDGIFSGLNCCLLKVREKRHSASKQ